LKIERAHNRNSAHVECEIKLIPVIIGATGTVSDPISKYLSNAPGKQEVKERHATTILGNAHTHTAESANVKVQDTEH